MFAFEEGWFAHVSVEWWLAVGVAFPIFALVSWSVDRMPPEVGHLGAVGQIVRQGRTVGSLMSATIVHPHLPVISFERWPVLALVGLEHCEHA